MLRTRFTAITAALIGSALAAPAQAQQPNPPPFATTKVSENVYIFRYGGHQSMFIVTAAGVIATDPISERRPAKPYIEAIQEVTKAPIKYGHLEKLLSLAIADSPGVNVNESERERSGIIRRQFCGVRRVEAIFRGAHMNVAHLLDRADWALSASVACLVKLAKPTSRRKK
jgi:hypothetical protein